MGDETVERIIGAFFIVIIILACISLIFSHNPSEVSATNVTFHKLRDSLYIANFKVTQHISVGCYPFYSMVFKHSILRIGQKYPIQNVSINELLKLAEKSHFIYYDDHYIYTLATTPSGIKYVAYVHIPNLIINNIKVENGTLTILAYYTN